MGIDFRNNGDEKIIFKNNGNGNIQTNNIDYAFVEGI